MSGRKNRMAKRKSGIYLDAAQTMAKKTKLDSGAMKTEQSRRDRVDELIREHFKKDT